MTLFIFKYCLPALLGYTLFVGIAGRLNPFAKPHYPEERPSWLLGLWTALSVCLVLSIGLHMAYGLTLQDARTLATPSFWFLATLLTPGFIVYFVYRAHIRRLDATSDISADEVVLFADAEAASSINADDTLDIELDLEPTDAENASTEKQGNVVATFLESIDTQTIETSSGPHATNDESSPILSTDPDALTLERMHQSEMSRQIVTRQLSKVRMELDEERVQHRETEKHLRITRKALSVLEADSREFESRKADALITLEQQLTGSVSKQVQLEHKVEKLKASCVEHENTIIELKQDVIKAKREARKNIAARAKALSTANKSIAFARQTLHVRANLEAEARDLKEALKNRQATISSLIGELEREQKRTEEDIARTARALVSREKQKQARHSLESVARSVEDKLSSRLVKKVAKARPATFDE